ncbi:MAG: DUF1801 domain-containing protein [Rhizobiaceae bacterium]
MNENKTKPGRESVSAFVASIEHEGRKDDAQSLLESFARVTELTPRIWGKSIVGYGQYHYKYKSGRQGDYFLTGFAPRQSAMTIYVMPGFKKYGGHLQRLGPHRHSVSCLYISSMNRIDLTVLEDMICDSVQRMKEMYEWKP